MKIRNALSVDVEDAVNLAMRTFFGREMEPTVRVVHNTRRLLELFAEFRARATFFILGEVAKTHPGLVREIASGGHELGIHGYSHRRYSELTREELKEEISTAKKRVEDLTGTEVMGHRAPEFSINRENLWALEILVEAGIRYDSSIFPAESGRYGWKGFEKEIHRFEVGNGKEIIEFPLSTLKLMGREIPACGGGYLRGFPYAFSKHAFSVIQKSRPVNVYLHPYEIDPPPFQDFYMDEIRNSSFRERVKLRGYWYNRRSVIPKLRNLLDNYHFTTLREVINSKLQTSL